MNDITKIIESQEKSDLLLDSASETVIHEINKFLGATMAPLAASLIAPMGSSLIHPVASSMTNAISEKGVTRAEKKKEGGIFPLLALPLMMKFLGQ